MFEMEAMRYYSLRLVILASIGKVGGRGVVYSRSSVSSFSVQVKRNVTRKTVWG
jgi:hypothetical protein